MKISISDIKETPPNMPFNFCVFGQPSETIHKWCEYWELETEPSGKFINIIIPSDLELMTIFEKPVHFQYMDGFSPNLNKHLHVGHLSNLIIASALYHMWVAEKTIAIMGDTLDGEVKENEAMESYKKYCKMFNYNVFELFYASKMEYDGPLLKDGEGTYEGTKIFEVDDEKLVAIKSDGSTSYFYQDVALITTLDAPTLYLTGFEQNNHFQQLNRLFPDVNHIGLGLVMVDGMKMSSRDGNVIYASELINTLMEKFDDEKLVANIIAGQILKSKPESVKNIDTTGIFDPKQSQGLYLSYTMARLKSAGMEPFRWVDRFNSRRVEFALLKAKHKLSPNILFEALVDLAKEINVLYIDHTIKDNEENQKMFQPKLNDLYYGMRTLGMHEVDKV